MQEADGNAAEAQPTAKRRKAADGSAKAGVLGLLLLCFCLQLLQDGAATLCATVVCTCHVPFKNPVRQSVWPLQWES